MTEPNLSEELVELAQQKLEVEDYQGAIVDYNKAIEINPDDGFYRCQKERLEKFLASL